jgi:site-specific DNA-methyltransferase (adenine-specific)
MTRRRLKLPALAPIPPAYETDRVRLYLGDCLRVLSTLPHGAADVIVADPPYSSGARQEAQRSGRAGEGMTRTRKDLDAWFGTDNLTTNAFYYLMRECALEWARILPRGGHAFVFIDWRMAGSLAAAIESADLRHVNFIVWDKMQPGQGRHFRSQHELILHFTKGVGREPCAYDQGNVIRCPPVRSKRHGTEKPVAVVTRLLRVAASRGAKVLDCFNGSGTTGEAALKLGMHYLGIDNEARFLESTAERLEDVTDQGDLLEPMEQGGLDLTAPEAEDPAEVAS